MKLSKIIPPLPVLIICNVVFLFLIPDKVNAAQIYCKLPGGEVIEMYKSECKSKEGVQVEIKETTEKKRKDCSKFTAESGLSLYDKIRCKMGYEERKKGKFKKKLKNLFKNPLKKKN